MQQSEKYQWSHLNHLQVGKYAEYLVKMELTLYGVDIYTSDVDDRGIDFVARKNVSTYYDFQVKSVRDYKYIFFPKDKFQLCPNLIAAVVVFVNEEPPNLFAIPSLEWERPNKLLVSRDYEGKKSKPEWGLNISQKNWGLLKEYEFEKVVRTFLV